MRRLSIYRIIDTPTLLSLPLHQNLYTPTSVHRTRPHAPTSSNVNEGLDTSMPIVQSPTDEYVMPRYNSCVRRAAYLHFLIGAGLPGHTSK